MNLTKQIPKATVKVLRSHDYNHFEFIFEAPEGSSLHDINELRKDAERLADEAVRQYNVAREEAYRQTLDKMELERLTEEVKAIKQRHPNQWGIEEKAKVKALDDFNWHNYDYDDDLFFQS